jgi:hypothetical protein
MSYFINSTIPQNIDKITIDSSGDITTSGNILYGSKISGSNVNITNATIGSSLLTTNATITSNLLTTNATITSNLLVTNTTITSNLNVGNTLSTNNTCTNFLSTNSTIVGNLISANSLVTNLTSNSVLINNTLTATSSSIPLIKSHGQGSGANIICDDSSNTKNKIQCTGDPAVYGGMVYCSSLFIGNNPSSILTINQAGSYFYTLGDLSHSFINRSGAGSGITDYIGSVSQFTSGPLNPPFVFTTSIHNTSSNSITIRTSNGAGLANIYGNYAGNPFLNGSTGFVLDVGRYVQLTLNVYDSSGDYYLFIVG